MEIPTIDISPFASGNAEERREVAREWDEAFSTFGFALLTGHGISPAIQNEIYRSSREFFALPVDDKMTLASDPGRGYEAFNLSNLGQTKGEAQAADLVEALMIQEPEWDRRGDMPAGIEPNSWPARPLALRRAVDAYIEQTYSLAQRLMRISALALGLEENFFDRYYDRMMHNLRLAWYPDQVEPPLPGQLRCGPHTDFTGFTILLQDEAPGGLQVQGPRGQWIDVRPVPGSLVINSGDLLQRWTNDRWRSNVHRVVNPPRHITGSTARLSIVLFTGPNADAEVECLPSCATPDNPPRYGPVRSHDYLMQKIAETFA